MSSTSSEISAAYAARGRTQLATADPRHRSPVHPDVTVVNATNADLRAEQVYRNLLADGMSRHHHEVIQKYAIRFILDSEPGEDTTDANLARVLGGCVRRPKPDEYPAIRMHVDTYRMAQMSAADAIRDKLLERAESYARDARTFTDMTPKLGFDQAAGLPGREDCQRYAATYRTIAGELRKVAESL